LTIEEQVRAERKERLDGNTAPLPEHDDPTVPKMARLDCPGSSIEFMLELKSLKK